MLTVLWRRIDKYSENFNNKIENVSTKQFITELKNTLDRSSCRMVEREEQTSKLEDKAMQNSSQSSKMKKKLKEVKITYGTSLKTSCRVTFSL